MTYFLILPAAFLLLALAILVLPDKYTDWFMDWLPPIDLGFRGSIMIVGHVPVFIPEDEDEEGDPDYDPDFDPDFDIEET